MKELIGDNITVFLNIDDEQIDGVFVNESKESVYVQVYSNLYAIPKCNVKYYSFPLPEEEEEKAVEHEQVIAIPPTQPAVDKVLVVCVDRERIAEIPVPPTTNLSVFSDDVMKIANGNPEVKAALTNRTQNQIEYFPGQLYITTSSNDAALIQEQLGSVKNDVSFAMDNDVVNKCLSPSQMIGKVNDALKRKKANDQK